MFIIYHPRAMVRNIARELRVSAYFPRHGARNRRRRNSMNVAVNWGNSVLPTFNIPNPGVAVLPILNADITGSVTKVRTFELLTAAALPIPRTVIDVKQMVDGVPFYQRGKYLARKDRLSHGAGIEICEKGVLPEKGPFDFYSQVVTKAFEVRLHVAGGAIICEQFKFIPAGS